MLINYLMFVKIVIFLMGKFICGIIIVSEIKFVLGIIVFVSEINVVVIVK